MSECKIDTKKEHYSFEEFVEIIHVLRAPDGCPWDREQTHESLKTCLIEEAYEVLEGIDRYEKTKDSENLCEELGDIILQAVMHSEIAKEEQEFTIWDVIDKVATKMIRRHPHVFGNVNADNAKTALESWESVKAAEKEAQAKTGEDRDKRTEVLEAVPRSFPALYRAQKVIKKAAKPEAYITVPDVNEMIQRIRRALDVIEKESLSDINNSAKEKSANSKVVRSLEEVLLWSAGLAGHFNENAEITLTNAVEKFINITRV